jgi:hypothetical protein
MEYMQQMPYSPSAIGGLTCQQISSGTFRPVMFARYKTHNNSSFLQWSQCQPLSSPRSTWTQCIFQHQLDIGTSLKDAALSSLGQNGVRLRNIKVKCSTVYTLKCSLPEDYKNAEDGLCISSNRLQSVV